MVQRKALEVSIQKNKSLTEDLAARQAKQLEHNENKKVHTRQIENLEEEISTQKGKFRKEKESMEAELQEKRHAV